MIIFSIFDGRGKEKVAWGVECTPSDRIPVKYPDGTWSFGGFPQGPDRIFPFIKQILVKEIPWLDQL